MVKQNQLQCLESLCHIQVAASQHHHRYVITAFFTAPLTVKSSGWKKCVIFAGTGTKLQLRDVTSS